MGNPFGIEQVDIPGLLNLHQGLKRQRISDLMAAREYEIKSRQADREDRKEATLARVFMKGGGQASGDTGAAQQTPTAPAPSPAPTQELPPVEAPTAAPQTTITAGQAAANREAMGEQKYQEWKARNNIAEEGELPAVQAPAQEATHPLDNHAVGEPLPPRTDGLKVNMDALRDLYAIDPKGAAEIQKMVYDSDKQQLEKATARGEAMAVAAAALRALPEGQRQAEFQRNWASYLADRGYSADMLAQADLSDTGLSRYYFQGRTIEKIVDSAKDERDYQMRRENQDVDNARADRADARASRGEARADRADSRAAVRFRERDKDRAALAASGGGVRSDTSDLNY